MKYHSYSAGRVTQRIRTYVLSEVKRIRRASKSTIKRDAAVVAFVTVYIIVRADKLDLLIQLDIRLIDFLFAAVAVSRDTLWRFFTSST